MESVKSSLINFCKGFGIWFLLLLFNTRSGEADVNGFKIILDIIIAVILVGSYKTGKYIALLTAVLTVVVTLLPLPSGLEILLLTGISVLGGVLLKIMPEDILKNQASERRTFDYGTTGYDSLNWRSRNFFNPFESYSYSPDGGISICKGIIRRTYSIVPTVTTRARIHQCIWQRFLGFCDVSFQNNYTGQQFGEDCLKNIRFRSAMKLMQMLP